MARSMAFVFAAAAFIAAAPVHAQDEPVEPIDGAPSQGLADQLANPVANLISVPIQFNYDCCYGPADGDRMTVNIQPVIPISVAQNWNLITRTILPIVSQEETVRGEGGASGLGDTVQSFFLSPKKASNGFVWGVGPVFLWPTGFLGQEIRRWADGSGAEAGRRHHGRAAGQPHLVLRRRRRLSSRRGEQQLHPALRDQDAAGLHCLWPQCREQL